MIDPYGHGFTMYYKASSARLGEGTVVWQFATISVDVTTGKNCVIGSCAWIGDGTVMGDDVRVQHGAFIPRNSRLGNRVFVGPGVVFTDDSRPQVNNPSYKAEPPIVEDDAAIGAGAVILPGVRIGKGALVGAGAVVTHDVADGDTVIGIPARSAAFRGQNMAGSASGVST